MGATARVCKTFVPLAAGLLVLAVTLPGPARAQTQAESESCQFSLAIPKTAIYPLIQRLRGDDDIDGNAANVDFVAFLHQPKWKKGQQPKGLRLDLDLKIREIDGDGSVYQGSRSYEVIDKWIIGGTSKQIEGCLSGIFKKCVDVFASSARTEAQLMAQCTYASTWQIKDVINGLSPTNNRKWVEYRNENTKLIKSIECLADANGPDTGKIGCKVIDFRPNIRININFNQKAILPSTGP